MVGGTAVTEEFHPGFRNSVAAYTVSLLQPKVIARPRAAPARPADRRAARAELPAPARRPLPAQRRRPHRTRDRQVQRPRRRALHRIPRCAERGRRPVARAGAAGAAQRDAGATCCARCREAMKFAPIGARVMRLRRQGAARAVRSLSQVGRRLSRPMVRDRRGQGAVRLRLHRRQSGEPLHPRLGLRAAASLVRRGERQEGRLGPRHRRHGRDHAGDGEGGRRARRARSTPARRSSEVIVERGRATGVVLADGTQDQGARGRRQRQSEIPVRATGAARRACRASSRADGALEGRLRHVPHERRALRAAELLRPARPPATISPPASSWRRACATWTRPIATSRAHGFSQAPIIEMLIPSTLDDSLAPPGAHVASLFCQHVAPDLPDGKDATRSRT